ncbi:accessory gene regulator ArgB-like protein [Neomoorella thermoacetica]|uniref:accessory gene regulator ArgB-like protein n=1 Tax=Neomoorella thermoacetica TaxID=1525 RepID=UPI0008FB8F42|nr:accessory gene regulator B family protein [Moorella thermoacetica]OIQ60253.1 accessory protein regulator protein B [Moorella thermoacetica]
MSNSKFLERAAFYLANESGRDTEVILFGMRLFFTSASGYVALIIIASLLGILPHALAAAITASVFRIFSGGAHASSPLRCNLIGVGVFLTLGFISNLFRYVQSLIYLPVIIAIIGIYVIYRYVPAETPGKPVSSQVQRKYLRAISFSLLSLWSGISFWGLSSPGEFFETKTVLASCFGMAWQLFTLTPIGFKVVGGMDSMFKFSMERRG